MSDLVIALEKIRDSLISYTEKNRMGEPTNLEACVALDAVCTGLEEAIAALEDPVQKRRRKTIENLEEVIDKMSMGYR
jgi:hypothetical protein